MTFSSYNRISISHHPSEALYKQYPKPIEYYNDSNNNLQVQAQKMMIYQASP
jgi:hypothetical protein